MAGDVTKEADASGWSSRASTAGAGSISSTTMSASAAAAAWSTRSRSEYRRVMQVNVETMFLLSKHAIPAMIKTAKGGAIVNISSISALRPRGLTTYTDLEGRGDRPDPRDGGRSRHATTSASTASAPARCTRRWSMPRGMSEPARAQRAKASVLKIEGTGWDIGHAVQIPAQRPRPLHHRPGAGGRRRRDAAGARNANHRNTEGRRTRDGPPALSRGRPGRARISRHAQAQHQSAQAAGQLAGHGARLQRHRRLHPLQEQARPAPARARDPAGRLDGEVGIRIHPPCEDRQGVRRHRRGHRRA